MCKAIDTKSEKKNLETQRVWQKVKNLHTVKPLYNNIAYNSKPAYHDDNFCGLEDFINY